MLMALLFVVGIMNLSWIAALAILVLLEKVAPFGRLVARLACIGGGVWLLTQTTT
jgi:predicted metal-binding membrane protein